MLPETAVLNPSPSVSATVKTAVDNWETAQTNLLSAISKKKSKAELDPLREELRVKREVLHTAAVTTTPAKLQSYFQVKPVHEMTRSEFFAAWSYYQKFVTESALRHKVTGVTLDEVELRQFVGITEAQQEVGTIWLTAENAKKQEGGVPDLKHPYDHFHVAAIKAAQVAGKTISKAILAEYVNIPI